MSCAFNPIIAAVAALRDTTRRSALGRALFSRTASNASFASLIHADQFDYVGRVGPGVHAARGVNGQGMFRLKLRVSPSVAFLMRDTCTSLQSPHATSNTCLSVRRACELVRTLVEQGDICAALEAVPGQCKAALQVSYIAVQSVDLCLLSAGSASTNSLLCADCQQDQRLIFRLKKQEVVEHLRKGTPEAQQQALGESIWCSLNPLLAVLSQQLCYSVYHN